MSEFPVTLTPKAIDKVKTFIQDNSEGALRLGLRGGGCSGFQYTLALDYPKDEDYIYQQDEIEIVIDKDSVGYLKGSTLDYKDNLEEQGFIFDNPNATNPCGCGNSFRMDNQAGCDASDDIYFGDESAV